MAFKKKKMNALDWVALILLVTGGINWGLAVFDYNLVTSLLKWNWLVKVVYALVGISAGYTAIKIPMLNFRR